MWRTFRSQAMTGSAQPIFGDKLTAAMVIPPPDVDPIINVADTTIYQQGDRITLDAGQTNKDTVLVTTIKSPTQMQVTSQGAPYHAHANGAIIALSIACAEIIVAAKAGAKNPIYLGADNSVTNIGGGNVIYDVEYGYPFRETYSANWNTTMTSDLWMAGSLSDSAIVAAQVI